MIEFAFFAYAPADLAWCSLRHRQLQVGQAGLLFLPLPSYFSLFWLTDWLTRTHLFVICSCAEMGLFLAAIYIIVFKLVYMNPYFYRPCHLFLFLSYIQLCVWSSMNKISNTSNLTKQQHPEIVICMSHNEIIMKIGTCPSQFFIHLFNMTSHGCFVCMHFPPATYNLSF
jgi:hypothetical protein